MAKISLCLIAGNVEEYIERCLKSFAPIADEICLVRAIGNLVPDRTIEIAERVAQASSLAGKATGTDCPTFRWAEYENKGKFRHVITQEEIDNPENPTLRYDQSQLGQVIEGDTSDWPHLDDFAAARQQSFDMAAGDYIFWVDTDDVLKEGAEFVRLHADRYSYPVFMFPYDIFGRGVDFTRERMILRGSGKWTFPVHECFKFNNPNIQGIQDDRVVVQHLPHTSKTGSNDRNLRIMEAIPEKDLTPGLLYHLHGELLGMPGRQQEAIKYAKKALECKDLGRPERYEIFLNLGRMAQAPNEARALFHQAYMVDPCRREALGLLTCSALDYQYYPEAMAYSRQMLATTKPARESWNDRNGAYDWLGIDIYTQALRMNGEMAEAERCRKRLLERAETPIISLIHATRGRARQASIARKLWFDLAEHPEAIEHIFVFDEDDEDSAPLKRMHHLIVPKGGGCVNAWNSGAIVSTGDIIIQMSDDWMPLPRWDTLILERFGRAGSPLPADGPGAQRSDAPYLDVPRVLAVSDGHRKDDLLCMAIMTRAYFCLDYFMFHPLFWGVYSDNWFTKEAYRRGMVIEARDLVFTHNHPLFNGQNSQKKGGDATMTAGSTKVDSSIPSQSDAAPTVQPAGAALDTTYALQNAPRRYVEGKAVLDYLSASTLQPFNPSTPTDWSTIPGWFNYWQFYRYIAENLKDGDVVAEVGVWMGRSIIYLAQECKRLGKQVKIIAVDNFKGEEDQEIQQVAVKKAGGSIFKTFEANLERCGVADMVETWIGDSVEESVEIENSTLKFCFIDAAHDYHSVKRDIAAWLPKMLPNGILAGHDAQHDEVRKAVLEIFPNAVIAGPIWLWTSATRRAHDPLPQLSTSDTSTYVHSP